MYASDPPLLDRVLHARVEVLVRHEARVGLARLAHGRAPLVVVRADRGRDLRWLTADLEPELVAAVASELDPVAAGFVVPALGGSRGVAITATAASARALDFATHRGGFLRRARAAVGPERELTGRPEELAAALCGVLARAGAERVRAETADA